MFLLSLIVTLSVVFASKVIVVVVSPVLVAALIALANVVYSYPVSSFRQTLVPGPSVTFILYSPFAICTGETGDGSLSPFFSQGLRLAAEIRSNRASLMIILKLQSRFFRARLPAFKAEEVLGQLSIKSIRDFMRIGRPGKSRSEAFSIIRRSSLKIISQQLV